MTSLHQPLQQQQQLSSTTAPGKVFLSREELGSHYKSDWHKYNCKRKEAGLPLLLESEFQSRREAALAVRKESEDRESHVGTDHLKYKERKSKRTGVTSERHFRAQHNSRSSSVVEKEKQLNCSVQHTELETGNVATKNSMTKYMDNTDNEEEEEAEEQPPVIDPRQCLFDNTTHSTVYDNFIYMQSKYSFFIPDREYLLSQTSFIGYCSEKIHIGHLCLYCQRGFRSAIAVKDHMVKKGHCKIRYEEGVDLWEYEPFYDFTEANEEFVREGGIGKNKKSDLKINDITIKKKFSVVKRDCDVNEDIVMIERDDCEDGDDDDDSAEWEDVSEEGMEGGELGDPNTAVDTDNDNGDDFSKYQEQLVRQGFNVSPLGELVFPDGRIVGHRALSRYYRQRFRPETERAAVMAAKKAHNQHQMYSNFERGGSRDRNRSNKALLSLSSTVSIPAGASATIKGRQANGVLVPALDDQKKASFTALSLFRYKAVVRKSRREESRGRRKQQKTSRNINKMDKKANRMMNGVSVAHAPR